MSRDLGWGILGTAKIARLEVGPAIVAADRARLVAVGSRRLHSAQALADELGGATAHGGYEDLLADPEVDAVYIALPNSLHRKWAIAALEAGKHVLCEKPLGLTAADVRDMASAAGSADRVLLEAFMWRFHPRIRRVQDLLAAGVIGDIRLVRATYTVRNAGLDDPELAASSIRFVPELGGGALADLGCYCIDALQLFVDGAPEQVWSSKSSPAGLAVETSVSGELQFAGGVVGQFFASMESPAGAELDIVGTAGRIRMPKAFRIRPSDDALEVQIVTAGGTATETFPFEDQYRLEVEHFAEIVLDGASPGVPLDHSLRTARTLDGIRQGWTHTPAAVQPAGASATGS